jgi:hypothetical protein
MPLMIVSIESKSPTFVVVESLFPLSHASSLFHRYVGTRFAVLRCQKREKKRRWALYTFVLSVMSCVSYVRIEAENILSYRHD